jgi:hypothetical protein
MSCCEAGPKDSPRRKASSSRASLFRDRLAEPAGRRRAQSAAFLFQQSLAMSGLFDDLTAIPAAAVTGDLDAILQDADRGGRGEQGQRSSRVGAFVRT